MRKKKIAVLLNQIPGPLGADLSYLVANGHGRYGAKVWGRYVFVPFYSWKRAIECIAECGSACIPGRECQSPTTHDAAAEEP